MPDESLRYPYPVPELNGVIKFSAQDFIVDEILGFEPSGQGEHLLVQAEKTSLTTPELVDYLSNETGVKPAQIGYSGLKDKQAVTRQWLSIQLPGCKSIPEFSFHPQIRIVQSHWHDRKLRIGTHKANRFSIVLRQLQGDIAALNEVMAKVEQHGFANYFGEQRFGMQQDNVAKALLALSSAKRKKRLSRQRRSLLISSLRSELFNRVLSRRVEQGIWSSPLEGDLYMLAGSHSIFNQPLDEAIEQRYREHDLNIALSLPGLGETRLQNQSKEIEQAVFQEQSELIQCLIEQKVKWTYRENRATVTNSRLKYDPDSNEIHIQIELSRGVYLTTLLAHLGRFVEPGRAL